MRKISDAIRHAQTKDGGIVLDVFHGQMFGLNPVGSRILELLEQKCDEAHIADEIGRAYSVSVERARADVREFIEALRVHRIVEPDGCPEVPERLHGKGPTSEGA